MKIRCQRAFDGQHKQKVKEKFFFELFENFAFDKNTGNKIKQNFTIYKILLLLLFCMITCDKFSSLFILLYLRVYQP